MPNEDNLLRIRHVAPVAYVVHLTHDDTTLLSCFCVLHDLKEDFTETLFLLHMLLQRFQRIDVWIDFQLAVDHHVSLGDLQVVIGQVSQLLSIAELVNASDNVKQTSMADVQLVPTRKLVHSVSVLCLKWRDEQLWCYRSHRLIRIF